MAWSKQDMKIVIAEAPLLSYLFLASKIRLAVFNATGSVFAAQLVFFLGFALVGVVTFDILRTITALALKRIAGKRFKVGVAYNQDGSGRYIELPFGEYSFLEKTRIRRREIYPKAMTDDMLECYIYVAWKAVEGEKVGDYMIVTVGRRLEELLATTSKWIVDGGWDYVETDQAYPVTLYECDTKAFDVIRERHNLPADIPVYIVRDAPGLVRRGEDIINVSSEVAEKLAENAKRALDELRSKQLMAENIALRQELEAMEKTEKNIRALADKKLGALAAALEEAERRPPKPRNWKLDKWFWIFLIVIVLVIFGFWALSRWFAMQATQQVPAISAPANSTAGGGG